MRLGIMQPYLFPYIGYFQLISSVDKFIAYDDVTFIKQGWINRNNILLNQKAYLFTIPLVNTSSNTLICDTVIVDKVNWKDKFLKTIQQAYRKAPFYETVYRLIEGVIYKAEPFISGLAVNSIATIADYLGLPAVIQATSKHYGNNNLSAQERILDICKIEEADKYINPIGGTELYSKDGFKENGITLNFIKTLDIKYNQFSGDFVPWLSIIDVLMFNAPEDVVNLINRYELI